MEIACICKCHYITEARCSVANSSAMTTILCARKNANVINFNDRKENLPRARARARDSPPRNLFSPQFASTSRLEDAPFTTDPAIESLPIYSRGNLARRENELHGSGATLAARNPAAAPLAAIYYTSFEVREVRVRPTSGLVRRKGGP